MFVLYMPVDISYGVGGWADPKQFPDMFRSRVGTATNWWPNARLPLVVDGRAVETSLHLEVSGGRGYLFYAKDKQTLKDGLRICPSGNRVVAPNGEVGFFCGSYDFEKAGGWARSRLRGEASWEIAQAAGKAKGWTEADFMRTASRVRLKERGYFMFVCRSDRLAGIRNARAMLGDDVTLGALGRMMTGSGPKMTPQQTVATLMDELNLT